MRVLSIRPALREGNKRLGALLCLNYLISAALPTLEIIFRVETYGFAITARDRDDTRVLVLERLEQRFSRPPETVKRSVVMAGDVNVGLISAHVLQCSCRRESVQERC